MHFRKRLQQLLFFPNCCFSICCSFLHHSSELLLCFAGKVSWSKLPWQRKILLPRPHETWEVVGSRLISSKGAENVFLTFSPYSRITAGCTRSLVIEKKIMWISFYCGIDRAPNTNRVIKVDECEDSIPCKRHLNAFLSSIKRACLPYLNWKRITVEHILLRAQINTQCG